MMVRANENPGALAGATGATLDSSRGNNPTKPTPAQAGKLAGCARISDQQALALALAQQAHILQFSHEMKMFGFKNEAGESALRVIIEIAYAACPHHLSATGKLRAEMSVREMSLAAKMHRPRTTNAVSRLIKSGVIGLSDDKFWTLQAPNRWKNWLDTKAKDGPTHRATCAVEGGPTDVASRKSLGGPTGRASLDGNVARPTGPSPYSKNNLGSFYVKNDAGFQEDLITNVDGGGEAGGREGPIATAPGPDGHSGSPDDRGQRGCRPAATRLPAPPSLGLNGDQAFNLAEAWLGELFGSDFYPDEFCQDILDGFDPDGGNIHARDGIVRALVAELSTEADFTTLLDRVMSMVEGLVTVCHGPRRGLHTELAELSARIIAEVKSHDETEADNVRRA